MEQIPELLRFADGRPVSAQNWDERRQELVTILRKEEYGTAPPPPTRVQGRVLSCEDKCCSGHAVLQQAEISFDTPGGRFSFPMHLFMPKTDRPAPLLLMLNFRPDCYDRYYPAEEIIDRGFALAVICYEDVTKDENEFESGLAGMYDRGLWSWGKIGMWAWAASRALDWLLTLEGIDTKNTAVLGHSRLGKTALWCAAQDTRIRFACSNDSGCCGAALERGKHPGGETWEKIHTVFPHWFCPAFARWTDDPGCAPFDQHFLLGALAPRFVCVGSASLDDWADQYNEQLCCEAASPAWQLLGLQGYNGPQCPADVGEVLGTAQIQYHLRDGIHFFGRQDWLHYLDFIRKNLV